MKKIQRPLTIANLKIYFRERVYSMLDFNEFKKQQEKAIKYYKQFNEKNENKNKSIR